MTQSTPVMSWTLPAPPSRPVPARPHRLECAPLGHTRAVKTAHRAPAADASPGTGHRRSRSSRLAPLLILAVVAFAAGAGGGLPPPPAPPARARARGGGGGGGGAPAAGPPVPPPP